MMGRQSRQMAMIFVDMESLIPENHLLRKVDRMVSFDFIYDLLAPYYPATGRPSVDPVSLFKMLLIGYLYGIKSERRLVEEVQLNIAYRWFCGFELDDAIPDHSTFSKTRARRYQEFLLGDIFEVKYGINLELLNCSLAGDYDPDAVNFVARTSQNNGVVEKVKRLEGVPPQPAGVLTCAGGGSVLSTFVQKAPFYSGRDLYLLIPKYSMSLLSKLFGCTIIEANKYRFSYGRQANKTLPSLQLKLPAKPDGAPDFEYMETYIKSLPYSDRL